MLSLFSEEKLLIFEFIDHTYKERGRSHRLGGVPFVVIF